MAWAGGGEMDGLYAQIWFALTAFNVISIGASYSLGTSSAILRGIPVFVISTLDSRTWVHKRCWHRWMYLMQSVFFSRSRKVVSVHTARKALWSETSRTDYWQLGLSQSSSRCPTVNWSILSYFSLPLAGSKKLRKKVDEVELSQPTSSFSRGLDPPPREVSAVPGRVLCCPTASTLRCCPIPSPPHVVQRDAQSPRPSSLKYNIRTFNAG